MTVYVSEIYGRFAHRSLFYLQLRNDPTCIYSMCLPFVYTVDGTVSSNNNLNVLHIPFRFRKRDQTLYFSASIWDYLSRILHRLGHKTFVLLCTLILDPLLLKPVHCFWPCLGKVSTNICSFQDLCSYLIVLHAFMRVLLSFPFN